MVSPTKSGLKSDFMKVSKVLYYFVQIGSHASRTPLSITNFRRGHASLGPLPNLQVVTQAPNCLKKKKKAKKTKLSVQMPKFFEVSCKNSVGTEMSNR
jgi:hypothetical protein